MSIKDKSTTMIYDAGIHTYSGIIKAAAAFNAKAKKMTLGYPQVWDTLESAKEKIRGCIWVHAASLGEFEQGRPLIEAIREKYPGEKILLTFFSPSGYEVRKNYAGVDLVTYLPFDTSRNARKFLDLVRPKLAVFVKYEFWRNYLLELKSRKVPVILISGVFREGQMFFKPWGGMWREMLSSFSYFFVQDAGSQKLLNSLGFENVKAAGDTRFDRVVAIRENAKKIEEIDDFLATSPQMTMIFGSSWPQDEIVYIPWLNSHREVKAIIAPHEFSKARLSELKNELKNGAVLLSEYKTKGDSQDAQALIIDCFGLLSSIYAYGNAAYIGGGFGVGLHNINEAAVYGIPVVFGPNNKKFIEAREIQEIGAGKCVNNKEEFTIFATQMLQDSALCKDMGQKASQYITSKIGATTEIMNFLVTDILKTSKTL